MEEDDLGQEKEKAHGKDDHRLVPGQARDVAAQEDNGEQDDPQPYEAAHSLRLEAHEEGEHSQAQHGRGEAVEEHGEPLGPRRP